MLVCQAFPVVAQCTLRTDDNTIMQVVVFLVFFKENCNFLKKTALYSIYLCLCTLSPLTSPLQNGGECLRAYVSVALEQIAQWRDEQGNNGLWYVMQVVNQLLDPRTSEFTAAFVGRLVSTMISRAGTQLGEQLDQILRAILSKMQQAETLSVMQVKGRS